MRSTATNPRLPRYSAPPAPEDAVSTGVLSQMTSKADGSCLKQSLYFVWELEVEAGWEPSAADGEVARFERWDMARLETEVREGELLRALVGAFEGLDEDTFTEKVRAYDEISRLDAQKTSLLLAIKEKIKDQAVDIT